MNGHCLVCNAAAANGITEEQFELMARARIGQDGAGSNRTPKAVGEVPAYFPATLRARIETWDDERKLGNSLIVGLKSGWCWSAEGEGAHVRGFDTVDAVRGEKTQACHCALCNNKE